MPQNGKMTALVSVLLEAEKAAQATINALQFIVRVRAPHGRAYSPSACS